MAARGHPKADFRSVAAIDNNSDSTTEVEMVHEKVCTKCLGDPQPLKNFYPKNKSRSGYSGICKVCARAKTREWQSANPLRARAKTAEWQRANRERKNATGRRWKQKTGYDTSEHAKQLSRERRARHRKEAIETMGGECECCRSVIYQFLCFDHLGRWGAAHRRDVGQSELPSWLKKHNYPRGDGTVCATCGETHQGIRVLCYNCNMSVDADPDGICAHQRTEPIDYSQFDEKGRYLREWRATLREEVLTAYGYECKCCHEKNGAFLSVEHVGGWGGQHRSVVTHSSTLMWLKKHCYPKGGETCPTCGETHGAITVTCFNCNMSSAKNKGVCFHEETRRLSGLSFDN